MENEKIDVYSMVSRCVIYGTWIWWWLRRMQSEAERINPCSQLYHREMFFTRFSQSCGHFKMPRKKMHREAWWQENTPQSPKWMWRSLSKYWFLPWKCVGPMNKGETSKHAIYTIPSIHTITEVTFALYCAGIDLLPRKYLDIWKKR